MEHYKISKLINNSTASKFVTKMGQSKWFTSGKYSTSKNVWFKTSMLRSDSYGYNYSYIVVKRAITVEGNNVAKTRNKNRIFKNNAPFWSFISKINNTFIDNAEDLDIIMPMYNLLEYSDNYSVTSGRLWNYYRDEVNDDSNEDNAADIKISNKKTLTGKYFEYKAKSIGSTPNNNNNTLGAEVVVPLKYFSNVWRSLDLPSINCKIELNLSWSKECIMSEI